MNTPFAITPFKLVAFATLILAALGLGGCATASSKPATISALLPAGVAPERAATLIVSEGIKINTFDGRFAGWDSGPKKGHNINPNGGRQTRALLLAPGAHTLALASAPKANGGTAQAGEWLLSHHFEAGHTYRVTASSQGTNAPARFESQDASGGWAFTKSLPFDAKMTAGRASMRKLLENAGYKVDR